MAFCWNQWIETGLHSLVTCCNCWSWKTKRHVHNLRHLKTKFPTNPLTPSNYKWAQLITITFLAFTDHETMSAVMLWPAVLWLHVWLSLRHCLAPQKSSVEATRAIYMIDVLSKTRFFDCYSDCLYIFPFLIAVFISWSEYCWHSLVLPFRGP